MSIASNGSSMSSHDFEGPLERLICDLVLDRDEKCKALIRLLRLIDHMDDDDKHLITSMSIQYAYNYTHHCSDGLQQYLTELGEIDISHRADESAQGEQ